MFPYNPFDDDHHHHHIIKRSSSEHQNPNPDPPFLLPFPSSSSSSSPFFNVSPLDQILLHNQITPKPEEKHVQTRRNLGAIPRRRAGKKDRHSKICTAQGIRDRRMRLSLQIARKFFDLQDALGYDKASKTIEWLFTKSKKAIRELANKYDDDDDSSSCGDAKSESLVVVSDDCEAVSGILIYNNNNNPSEERERAKRGCKPDLRSELREKARARARCRTREKMMAKLGFSNSTTYEGVHQGSNLNNNNNINQEKVSLYDSLEQQFGDVGTIDKFLGNSSIVSCPNYSDYYQRSVSGYMDPNNSFMSSFFGNWDVLNGAERTNSSTTYGDANQISFGENPSSIHSVTP